MHFAAICPPGLLYKYGSVSNYHLVLPHVLTEHPDALDWYAESLIYTEDYIIVDNSAAELMIPWETASVIKIAHDINAHEIVLPDFIKKKDETLAAVAASKDIVEDQWTGKVMAVPQGKDLEEWFECLDSLIEDMPHVNVIGIPKGLEGYSRGGRNSVLLMMEEGGYVDTDRYEYHLLGVGNNPVEAYRASKFDWIRGMDSGLPIYMGLCGTPFHPTTGVLERPEIHGDFFGYTSTDDKRPAAVLHNIACMLNWCEGRPGHQV